MDAEDRNFKGIWIPKKVYLDKSIAWTAKIIFMEIHSFTEGENECFMSNEYLAGFVGISVGQVSRHISTLIEKGWIEQVSFDGRRRTLRSTLEDTFSSERKADLRKSARQDTHKPQGSNAEKRKHTNTVTKPVTKPVKEKVPLVEYREKVHMTLDEFTKLQAEHGSEATAWMLDKLNNYKLASGKTYKSDYRAILTWVVDSWKQQNRQAPKQNLSRGSSNIDEVMRQFGA